jgi:signal transduction histidine kinase
MVCKAMNSHPEIQTQPQQSFFRYLLKSHLVIALIGVLALLIALIAIFLQTGSIENLSSKTIPAFQTSSLVLRGVQHSLASMRGWVSLKDETFIQDWNQTWDNTIDPAAARLKAIGMTMGQPGFNKRMAELTRLLAELKESQWWIIEIAQTPGNEPAKTIYQLESLPILQNLDEIIRSLFLYEKNSLSGALKKKDQYRLHDIGILYFTAREMLQKIIFQGKINLEAPYFSTLHMLQSELLKLTAILNDNGSLDTIKMYFQREIAALEKISAKSIAIRKSNNWNVSSHLMKTETVPLAQKTIRAMTSLTKEMNGLMTKQVSTSASIGKYSILGLFALIVVLFFSALTFSRKKAADLTRPVLDLVAAAHQMAAGTLSKDIPPTSANELGDLARSFNFMRREVQESQQKLRRQEKLAAIGQLSGSVAHDIRNPLGAISNSIFFIHLISDEKTDVRVKEHITIMKHEIDRANDIINDLMNFSKENKPTFITGDLNNYFQRIITEFDSSKKIQLILQPDNKLPLITFDRSQMERIMHNLILNATQAITDRGKILIQTSHDDEFVRIVISDTGHGIAQEDLNTIFEPLYTTRASGVGLGLPIIKDLIERHQGTIDVKSVVDKGSTFTVQLPIRQNVEK